MPLTAYGADGIRNLIDVARRNFEYVVVDLPVVLAPWTDSVLKSASVIYLVTSLSVPSAHRVTKFLDLLPPGSSIIAGGHYCYFRTI